MLFSYLDPRAAEQAGLLLGIHSAGSPSVTVGRVCLCCGAWPQLQAGHLVPQGELLGKTLIQAFARQWKICNSWESLMEINNFLIILCLRIDLLSSCVLSYLHLKQSYVSLLWYCECFKIFRTNTYERSKSSSNSTNSMLFFQLEFLLILIGEEKLDYFIFSLQRFPHFHGISRSVPVCGLLILPLY